MLRRFSRKRLYRAYFKMQ